MWSVSFGFDIGFSMYWNVSSAKDRASRRRKRCVCGDRQGRKEMSWFRRTGEDMVSYSMRLTALKVDSSSVSEMLLNKEVRVCSMSN
jgi:hypothetical protein